MEEFCSMFMISKSSLISESQEKSKKQRRKENKALRPPNSFILYRKYQQSEIKKRYKNLTNANISKVVSKMWQNESEKVKFQFEKLADQMKVEHQKNYPDYEYRAKKKLQRKFNFNSLSNKKNNLPDEDITQIANSALLNSNPPQFITSEISQPSPLSPPPSFILEEFLNYSTTIDQIFSPDLDYIEPYDLIEFNFFDSMN
ncbi:34064_t:CDS:1 [Gigaspora margarita]|uniref:34064_t:CDS:1 n=1 Tax=Gigaspora margarita TaxID=4874 RepID=A0ABN7UT97_GIGMA|nr:34064_t:CDS:1 [Gigaspora margarita]